MNWRVASIIIVGALVMMAGAVVAWSTTISVTP
jgi:VIT1/CCC1 family predicted Fe2+/Mn2+ transporter